jgi:pimeloyl-ACP methyl ester carboxylesterase
MDTLTKKTITTKRGFEYTYYVSPAAAGKPTLLLHHGFPDQANEWEQLITNHLKPAGYGVIAPDLLGYGGTSKPTDPAACQCHSSPSTDPRLSCFGMLQNASFQDP